MRLPLALAALSFAVTASAQERPKPPYWASIAAGKARMRTGPARTYPASWLYQRADLPVRVVAVFKEWRRVQDPGGTEGWMLGGLISSDRTAIVRSAEPVPMREGPNVAAKLLWRASPGVVGRLSECRGGWCRLDVKGQAGFVEVTGLWGVEAGERLP
ncbi:SH3 domain-containing protein [uncultured Sphingomonas sp.]|uniref:SH3 domain-containing protein n=1 Tax=uncultured Sphingomonas sp. TaxID=158754 RepID=UPI0035C9D5B2